LNFNSPADDIRWCADVAKFKWIQGVLEHEQDGWHATGDLGYFDQKGRLMLTQRIADVIKTGGYRVNPDEIELQLVGAAQWDCVCITSLSSEYWAEGIIAVAEGAKAAWTEELSRRLSSLSNTSNPESHWVSRPCLETLKARSGAKNYVKWSCPTLFFWMGQTPRFKLFEPKKTSFRL
jgi:acyl-CoA synthetase (AMP-forming)/AMP-acid ligase II